MVTAVSRLVLIAVVLLHAAATGSPVLAGGDWPGWRGPGRDGLVTGFEPPARWPAQLTRIWRLEVGTGYSSPVVSDGRVYLQSRQEDDEVVRAVDLESGRVLWLRSYATPFTPGPGSLQHGKGPKSTPALAERRLFTASITGLLSAWNAESGELLWRKDFASRFRRSRPVWGVAASPIVDGPRVVTHFGTDGDGALVALEAASGLEVWSLGDDGPSYASPILVELGGIRQIVTLTEKALIGVDPESGGELWRFPFPQNLSDQNMITPLLHDGLVVLSGENRGVRALEPLREGDAWTVRELWHVSAVALDMSSPVVSGDLLFGFSHFDKGRIFCLDLRDGGIRWQGPGRTGENVALLVASGLVMALKDDGGLWVLEAEPEQFRIVASYQVADTPTWAHPVLVDGGILIKDAESLALWSFEDPEHVARPDPSVP